MQSQDPIERPYRSHLRPACLQCKRRKSRCKIEAHSPVCLMCRVHGTSCTFPQRVNRGRGNTTIRAAAGSTSQQRELPPVVSPWSPLGPAGNPDPTGPTTTLSGDDEDQENPHIVGPANTNDSQVLTDYLSIVGSSNARIWMVHPVLSSRSSKPVLFAAVKKRPVGVEVYSNHAREKLNIIEQLLAPHAEDAVEFFFQKINTRLPLLDADSFKHQYKHAKEKISPALLACLYAHNLIYWQTASEHFRHHKPDGRFIWNLANDALYSELQLSPGISTITAILLNVGGRPTTSLIGNGVQLGAALSLAHSLGLNRNPLPWDLPESEKLLRAKMWWSLQIYDKWYSLIASANVSSLAHGTPPRIQSSQHDVPPPEPLHFHDPSESGERQDATAVFIALYGLTEVLGECLYCLYDLSPQSRKQQVTDSNLEFRLNSWVESLTGPIRGVILRGHNLSLPGAANLRLAYLATLLLLRRMELEASRENAQNNTELSSGDLPNKYLRAQQVAEEIVLLVSELGRDQLGDFWLPGAAFVFSSTETFLLRCAVECDTDVKRSSLLRIAWDFIVALRRHREEAGWDLGDICLAQYEDVVRRLVMPSGYRGEGGEAESDPVSSPVPELQLQDLDLMAQLFPEQWSTEIL